MHNKGNMMKAINTIFMASAFMLASSTVIAQDLSITVTNLTQSLHFTLILTAAHANESNLFMVTDTATLELQMMAEGEDISGLTSLLSSTDANINENPASGLLAPASGEGIVLTGASSTVTISTTNRSATYFTSATMLVNTNDAFSGLTGIDISTLAINDKNHGI